MTDDTRDWANLIRTMEVLAASALGAEDAHESRESFAQLGEAERFGHLAAAGAGGDAEQLVVSNAGRDVELVLVAESPDVVLTVTCAGYSALSTYADNRAIFAVDDRSDLMRLLKFDDRGRARATFAATSLQDFFDHAFTLSAIEEDAPEPPGA